MDNDNSPRDWNTVAENKFQFQLLKLDLLEWLVLLEVDEAVELETRARDKGAKNCSRAASERLRAGTGVATLARVLLAIADRCLRETGG